MTAPSSSMARASSSTRPCRRGAPAPRRGHRRARPWRCTSRARERTHVGSVPCAGWCQAAPASFSVGQAADGPCRRPARGRRSGDRRTSVARRRGTDAWSTARSRTRSRGGEQLAQRGFVRCVFEVFGVQREPLEARVADLLAWSRRVGVWPGEDLPRTTADLPPLPRTRTSSVAWSPTHAERSVRVSLHLAEHSAER